MNPHLTQSQAHTVMHPDQQSAANTRLRGGRLVFARISWLLLAALALPVFVTGLPLYFANLQVICNSYSCKYGQLLLQSAQVLQNLGIPIDAYAVFALMFTIAIITVWFIVGGVIFWRKSDDWIALLVSLALILFASTGGFNSGWNIDILINRTLVYTALTGTLAVVYIACILILQALLSSFTSGNTVALVGSTLGVAALFQPLRRRIQTRIDRRFYRRKYDAARTIAAFSATLRGKVVLNTLSEQLVAVVQETMQPAHVSLWLQQHDRQGQQQYRALVTAEIAPSQQIIGPLSETDIAETSEEMPRPSPRKISRRAVMIELAAGGVALAGGLSWWLLKRRATFTYTGHTDWVYDVAWSPDGTRIASCSKDKTVQITGSRIFTYRGHTADVYTAAWSPDGRRIASCWQDKTVQIWSPG